MGAWVVGSDSGDVTVGGMSPKAGRGTPARAPVPCARPVHGYLPGGSVGGRVVGSHTRIVEGPRFAQE